MSPIKTERYLRKPLYVQAIQVSEVNLDDVAKWCGGFVMPVVDPIPEDVDSSVTRLIDVPVVNAFNLRQKQAYPGDYVVKASNRNYKVYTDKAFKAAFVPDQVSTVIS